MKLKFLAVRKLKLLIVLTILIIASLAFSGYRLKSLSIAPPPSKITYTVADSLPERDYFAQACDPSSDPLECKGNSNYVLPISYEFILPQIELISPIIDKCSEGYLASNKGKSADEMDAEFSLKSSIYSCLIKLVDRDRPTIEISIELVLPKVDFTQGFDTDSITTQNNQKLLKIGSANFETKIDLVQKNVDGQLIWTLSETEIDDLKDNSTTISGTVDTPFIFNLNKTENYSSYLESLNLELKNNNYEIDLERSSWDSLVTGQISGAIKLDWKFAIANFPNIEINYQKLEFCSQECAIDIKEEQVIYGKKTATYDYDDDYGGNFSYRSSHNETYRGTGSGNPTTGRVQWNENLSVSKSDNRFFEIDYQSPTIEKWQYQEHSLAVGAILPFKNTGYFDSTETKNLVYQPVIDLDAPGKLKPIFTSLEANTDIQEKKRHLLDETLLSRSGDGSRKTTSTGQDYNQTISYNGIFDSESDLMLVTASNTEGMVGQRVNPFEGIEAKIFTNFIPQQYRVLGYFTASSDDNEMTVIGLPKIKSIPQNVYIFYSWDETDPIDSRVFKNMQSSAELFAKELRDLGVNVTIKKPTSAEQFLEYLSKIKTGSWLVNIGHGSPDGFSVGSELVKASDITILIEEKQIRLDMFAAGTCYAARIPIGQKILNSISVGMATDQQSLGSIFGIGANVYSLTNNDLAKIFSNRIACLKQAP